MKKHTGCNFLSKFLFFVAVFALLYSCEKSEYIQNFDDVFDVSGIDALNQKVESGASLSELSVAFENISVKIPEGLENVTLDEMIQHYQQSVVLTESEIDLLLKNDSKTYIDVINRMGSLPANIAKLNIDFSEVKSSELNKYLLVQKAETENFYSDNYYSAVLAMKYYIESKVIEPMNTLKRAVITIPPGNGGDQDDHSDELLYYKLITSNNNWDMWWAYWGDGTRTKHKGAKGSFPGL